ncbi:hypothetical protein, partial [Salmonella enterica]|uniref:hypothetical protein n=1 Tax=Salmonella enterica TaxID=28901 RepID=UPI0020C51735
DSKPLYKKSVATIDQKSERINATLSNFTVKSVHQKRAELKALKITPGSSKWFESCTRDVKSVLDDDDDDLESDTSSEVV